MSDQKYMNTNSVDFFNRQKVDQFPDNCEIILAVWEIRNPGNIGQIIRLAHNLNAKKVLFVNDEINFRNSKIKKTAGFSFDQMDWEFISQKKFLNLSMGDYQFAVVETCNGSTNVFTTELPDKIILLAGSESFGLPAEIINRSTCQVHIPMPGGCKSMNVSHAISVVAFEWYRKKIIEKLHT